MEARFALLASVIVLCTCCASPANVQAASRVGVLYTGDPYPGQTPYIYMKVEPFLSVTPVQASRDHYAGISQKDILRAIRVYMPRAYQELVETYDVIIISDSNVASFSADQLIWFKRAVSEQGTGLVMIGGHETYGTNGQHPDWGPTPVGDVLPVSTIRGVYEGGPTRIVDFENEFIRSLPWRPDLPFLQNYACSVVKPREGSRVLAISTIDRSKYVGWENPFFSTWDYAGNGRVFAMTGDWTPGGGVLFLQWEFLPDFVANLMLYCSKRGIPQDYTVVHEVRERLATLGFRKMLIASLVDFVETFGANPRRILLVVQQCDDAQGKASDLYLRQEFNLALSEAKSALDLANKAEKVAEEVKNDALLWVYISEWLALTATSLVCGLAVWALMLRRRLYREVGMTSFREGTGRARRL